MADEHAQEAADKLREVVNLARQYLKATQRVAAVIQARYDDIYQSLPPEQGGTLLIDPRAEAAEQRLAQSAETQDELRALRGSWHSAEKALRDADAVLAGLGNTEAPLQARWLIQWLGRLLDQHSRLLDEASTRPSKIAFAGMETRALGHAASQLETIIPALIGTADESGLWPTLDNANCSVTLTSGQVEPLTEIQFRVVSRLIKARGGWLTSRHLRALPDSTERIDHVIWGRNGGSGLPDAIQRHIESGRAKGYRWLTHPRA
jgi:hypothetical protein